eukprot:2144285-Amphidinium_carterae.1
MDAELQALAELFIELLVIVLQMRQNLSRRLPLHQPVAAEDGWGGGLKNFNCESAVLLLSDLCKHLKALLHQVLLDHTQDL